MNEEFLPKGFVEVHEITDIISFLKSVSSLLSPARAWIQVFSVPDRLE